MINPEKIHQDNIELHEVIPIEKRKHFDTLRPQKGQKVWELDLVTQDITEVINAETSVNFLNAMKGDNSSHAKVMAKDTSLFCCAINKKNANKHFVKMLLKTIHQNG